jgi:hypothetical protein
MRRFENKTGFDVHILQINSNGVIVDDELVINGDRIELTKKDPSFWLVIGYPSDKSFRFTSKKPLKIQHVVNKPVLSNNNRGDVPSEYSLIAYLLSVKGSAPFNTDEDMDVDDDDRVPVIE